jgi:hypothetical protein
MPTVFIILHKKEEKHSNPANGVNCITKSCSITKYQDHRGIITAIVVLQNPLANTIPAIHPTKNIKEIIDFMFLLYYHLTRKSIYTV